MSAARASVLSYFSASPDDYVCIFTPNCTGALKIVGESFPFQPPTQRGLPGSGSSFILAEDSHNSVNGIRAFAEKVGADVRYVKGARRGGFDQADMMVSGHFICSIVAVFELLERIDITFANRNLISILVSYPFFGPGYTSRICTSSRR